MFRSLRGSGLKTRLLHPVDEFWDQRLRVRTFGYRPAVGHQSQRDWRAHYDPTPYKKILNVLRHVNVGRDDVYADFGCGLGRTVFVASWLGAKRAVGVEINPELIEAARGNLARSRLAKHPVEFVCAPAESYELDDVSVLFMFHPFGSGTVESVIRQLDASLDRKPRRVRVVYENPVHADVIDGSRHLKRSGAWPVEKSSGSVYAVNFWQTAG